MVKRQDGISQCFYSTEANNREALPFSVNYGASLAACHFDFHKLPNLLIILSSTQQIPHLLTILYPTCRPKDKDKVLHSRLSVLEPLSMKSSYSAACERSLRMNHFKTSERTSSSSYITTRMAEKFLLQGKLS